MLIQRIYLMMKLKKILIKFLRFYSLIAFVFNLEAMEDGRPVFSSNNNNNGNPISTISWNDAKYLSHERMRYQCDYSNSLDLVRTLNNYRQLKHDYSVGAYALKAAYQIGNIQELKPFLDLYASNKDSFSLVHNRNTIDRLVPVLFTANGYLKQDLNSYERYQIARIVTDYFKIESPNNYMDFVNQHALQGNKEFLQILKEETTYGSWLKYETVQFCGLLKGLFVATSFNGDIDNFRKVFENSEFFQCYANIDSLTLQYNFKDAKNVLISLENNKNSLLEGQFQVIEKLYNDRLNAYCDVILKEFNIADPNQKVIGFIKELILTPEPLESGGLIYSSLMNDYEDIQFRTALYALLDDHGIPRCCSYDKSLLKNVPFPSAITHDQIKDRLLILKIAVTQPKSVQERIAFTRSINYLAQACSDNPLAQSYSDLAHATIKALNNQSCDKTILECTDFSLIHITPEMETLQRRTVPLVANLVNEIASTNNTSDSKHLKSELFSLNKQFNEAKLFNDAQKPLFETIERLNLELKTFSRPEMHRSPSMEKLFLARTAEFLVSTNMGSLSLDELTRFSGTAEQNALHGEIMHNLKTVSIKAAEIKDEKLHEDIKIYNKLLEEAYQLNKDSKVTLAKGVFAVAKDIAKVIFDERNPIFNEIGACGYETITHPIEYLSKTAEGFVTIGNLLMDYVKHNSPLIHTTEKEQLEYSQHYNNVLHNFLDGWQKLDIQQKREIVAQGVVDFALGKVIGHIPKLLSKTAAFEKFADAFAGGISRFEGAINDGLHGGAIALPISDVIPISDIIPAVRDVAKTLVAVADSPMVAAGVAVVTEAGALSHAMSLQGGGDSVQESFRNRAVTVQSELEETKKIIQQFSEEKPGSIWTKIEPTQEFWPHTNIPKSFVVECDAKKYWVSGNATDHLMENIAPNTNDSRVVELVGKGKNINDYRNYINPVEAPWNIPAKEYRISQEMLLDNFYEVLDKALKQEIIFNNKNECVITVSNWEIGFSKPSIEGGYIVVNHIKNW
jgi:hypothetical protein